MNLLTSLLSNFHGMLTGKGKSAKSANNSMSLDADVSLVPAAELDLTADISNLDQSLADSGEWLVIRLMCKSLRFP